MADGGLYLGKPLRHDHCRCRHTVCCGCIAFVFRKRQFHATGTDCHNKACELFLLPFRQHSGILRRGDKGHQGTVLHQKRGTVPSITIQGLCHHWQQRHGNGVFHTDVFESLPDEFIDVNLNQWKYDAGSDSVPIILPRNYLNLYNFGYATSQGLPTISEGIIKQIGIRLQLSGDQASVVRHGKVVAFSRTLNTILVPQTFMQEYNKTLSPGRTPQPSRLAVIATNIGDSKIADYLDAHGYDTEGNDADSAKTASFLRITTIIVSAVGIIICILSFYVLILSIFLLLQKHTEIIDSLLLIGYSPRSVAMPFYILAIGLNTIVAISAVWMSALLRDYYLPRFGELYPQLDTTEILPSLIAATAIYLLMCILNSCAVRRKINSIWHLHE